MCEEKLEPPFGTNHAELFSRFFSADSDNCCHIYEDGLTLVIACSENRHELIKQLLIAKHPSHESARTPDGFASVFVIPSPTILVGLDNDYGIREVADFCPLAALVTDCKIDHRMQDQYKLNQVVDLIKRTEQET